MQSQSAIVLAILYTDSALYKTSETISFRSITENKDFTLSKIILLSVWHNNLFPVYHSVFLPIETSTSITFSRAATAHVDPDTRPYRWRRKEGHYSQSQARLLRNSPWTLTTLSIAIHRQTYKPSAKPHPAIKLGKNKSCSFNNFYKNSCKWLASVGSPKT